MRTLASAAALLLTTVGLAACGSVDVNTDQIDDDLQELRDQADQAIEDVRDGAPARELRERLREVEQDLNQANLDDRAREELENARDQLREALR